jgi:hypothetical protein
MCRQMSGESRARSASSITQLSTSVVDGEFVCSVTTGAIFWNARKLLIVFWELENLLRRREIASPQMVR